jgi:MFS family permease
VLLGLAGATAVMAFASAVWVLVIAVFLLRLMGQGMMGHTAMMAMARWFVATRGRAIAIAGLGVALGEATMPILFVALKSYFDWRMLWLAAAGCPALLAILLFPLLSRERTPQSFAAQSGSLGMRGRNWTRTEVLRQRLFWLRLPMLLGPGAWNTAFFFHQVHFAEVKGWTHLELVALFPVMTVSGIASMLVTGWLIDRFGSTRIVGLHLLPLVGGYAIMGLTGRLGAAAVGMVMMGLAVGANSTLSSSLWAEAYGTAHLGRIRAMVGAIMVLGSAIGPGVTGWLIDKGWTMPDQCLGIAAYFLLAAGLGALGGAGARRLLGQRERQPVA